MNYFCDSMDLFYPEAISHPIFKKLSQTAQETGLDAYVVGGFVRNFFLKKESKDIDVVIVGSGVQFAKAFANLIDAMTGLENKITFQEKQ